jgi:hypothetical protein
LIWFSSVESKALTAFQLTKQKLTHEFGERDAMEINRPSRSPSQLEWRRDSRRLGFECRSLTGYLRFLGWRQREVSQNFLGDACSDLRCFGHKFPEHIKSGNLINNGVNAP